MVYEVGHFKKLYNSAQEVLENKLVQTKEGLDWCTMKSVEYAALVPIVLIEITDFCKYFSKKIKKK